MSQNAVMHNTSFRTKRSSFDQPIRAHEQRWRHVEPERLCCLEVDHKFEFRGLLDWQITRLGALENLVDKGRHATEDVVIAGHIRHQPPGHGTFVVGRDGRNSVLHHKLGEKRSLMRQKRVADPQRCIGPSLSYCPKFRIKFADCRYLCYIEAEAQRRSDTINP